mmetsp:Transcript_38361/g.123100  ORF Transcript_38361/g.123100 Transcript_38361/m.123100 type:complete len:255 (-) Transcript_38361:1823-2587(-)
MPETPGERRVCAGRDRTTNDKKSETRVRPRRMSREQDTPAPPRPRSGALRIQTSCPHAPPTRPLQVLFPPRRRLVAVGRAPRRSPSPSCTLARAVASRGGGYARYLYIRQLFLSRSRNSRSMSDSIRFLITFGWGMKRAVSCAVTSAMRALCSISLRDFMMRTIAASICGFRSSSTFWRVSCFSASVSRCAETVPTLKRSCLEEKEALKEKASDSSTSRPFGSLSRSLNLPHARDCSVRFSSAGAMAVSRAMSA